MKTCRRPSARLHAQRRPHDPGRGFARVRLAVPLARGIVLALQHGIAGAMRWEPAAAPRVTMGSGECTYGHVCWSHPRQARQRQPQPHRRIARQQKQVLAAQHPQSRLPLRTVLSRAALQRQHEADGLIQPALEHAADALPLPRIFQPILRRIHVDGQLPLLLQMVERIFERRLTYPGSEPQAARQRFDEALGIRRAVNSYSVIIAREQRPIVPQWRRRPCASNRPTPSAAAVRPDTICLAHSAATRPARNALLQAVEQFARAACASPRPARRYSTRRHPCRRSRRRSARRPSSGGCRRLQISLVHLVPERLDAAPIARRCRAA